MSKELDDRIDAVRARLIQTAGQQVGMGNYKQQLRSYQEMFLEVINLLDIEEELDKPEGAT